MYSHAQRGLQRFLDTIKY